MIQRVHEQATKAKRLSEVLVATDDQRIFDHVIGFEGRAVMTSQDHQSGTDRCAEVLNSIPDTDIVVNIQGDEPFVEPQQINLLVEAFLKNAAIQIHTLIKKITDREQVFDPNVVKVVLDENKRALYFSRQAIPYMRDEHPDHWLDHHSYYKHIGLYAYRTAALLKISKLSPGKLEKAESLEQLRWLENGLKIYTTLTTKESLGIDTPDDLKKAI